jgi:hypothetical protein
MSRALHGIKRETLRYKKKGFAMFNFQLGFGFYVLVGSLVAMALLTLVMSRRFRKEYGQSRAQKALLWLNSLGLVALFVSAADGTFIVFGPPRSFEFRTTPTSPWQVLWLQFPSAVCFLLVMLACAVTIITSYQLSELSTKDSGEMTKANRRLCWGILTANVPAAVILYVAAWLPVSLEWWLNRLILLVPAPLLINLLALFYIGWQIVRDRVQTQAGLKRLLGRPEISKPEISRNVFGIRVKTVQGAVKKSWNERGEFRITISSEGEVKINDANLDGPYIVFGIDDKGAYLRRLSSEMPLFRGKSVDADPEHRHYLDSKWGVPILLDFPRVPAVVGELRFSFQRSDGNAELFWTIDFTP